MPSSLRTRTVFSAVTCCAATLIVGLASAPGCNEVDPEPANTKTTTSSGTGGDTGGGGTGGTTSSGTGGTTSSGTGGTTSTGGGGTGGGGGPPDPCPGGMLIENTGDDTCPGQAIVLTSVLLVLGFSVMGTSDLTSTRDFGILASVTMTAALLGDLFLLPAMLHIFGKKKAS